MGTFTGLKIGLSSLQTHQAAMEVASGNVANAGNPDYHRREAILAEAVGLPGGVDVALVRRVKSAYIGSRIEVAEAQAGAAELADEVMQQIEAILGDTGEDGLNGILDRFVNAMRQLSAKPDDEALRRVAVEAGRDIAAKFRTLQSDLANLQASLSERIGSMLKDANTAAAAIAEANASLQERTSPRPELEDRRDAALRELARLVGARSTDGGNVVAVGGVAIVQGRVARSLEQLGQAGQFTAASVFLWEGDGSPAVGIGGALGEAVRLRDETIPGYMKALDELAQRFMSAVNEPHRKGTGLDGSTGADLFTGSGALDIEVNPDVAANPAKIAASATGAPGDATVAKQIVGAAEAMRASLRDLTGRLGAEAKAARERAEGRKAALDGLVAEQQSVSGVSLDEEMTNLIRFQKAYEAAARVVTFADELLSVLLRMGAG